MKDKDHKETMLTEKLGQLEERLARVKQDMSKSHSADFAEQATERENDEVLEGILQETQISIQDIRAALARIVDGSYGVCATCGDRINPQRLEALPASVQCIACAAQQA